MSSLNKAFEPIKQSIEKGLWIATGTALLLMRAAVPSLAVSLSAERVITNDTSTTRASETNFTGRSILDLDGAANIYVVDGINNTLEVFDTSIWLLPPLAEQSAVDSQSFGKVYFLDGINNTLQVLDTRSDAPDFLTDLPNPASQGKTYLVDEFNKSFQLPTSADGLVATSGNRNGLLSPPFDPAGEVAENFYVVDGFNNSLEISDAEKTTGQATSVPLGSETDSLRDRFFQGPLSTEDVSLSTILPLIEQLATASTSEQNMSGQSQTAQALLQAIAAGPFAEPVDTEAGIAAIIDSIGNPNRSLGWIKDFIAKSDSEGGEVFSLSREVDTDRWDVRSDITAGAKDAEDVYLVDGFNSLLQTVLTAEGETESGSNGSFSLVDGINNRLQVSNADAALFDLLLSTEPIRSNSEGSAGELTLDNAFSTARLVADDNRDYFRVNGLNNKIELFDQDGDMSLVTDTLNADGTSGIAQDGYGNIYVINGINNRIRGLTNAPATVSASVPEPGNTVGLLFATVGLLVRFRKDRSCR